MNITKFRAVFAGHAGLFCLFAVFLAHPSGAFAALEDTFDVLKIGTHTYRNVTVTTKAKNYIFLLHSGGMTNVRVDELSPEIRESLGYANPITNNVQKGRLTGTWAKKTLAKLETPQVKGVEQQIVNTWRNQPWRNQPDWRNFSFSSVDRTVVAVVIGGALALYLGVCYCFMLICQKLGYRPGIYVWLPVVQILALLQAAGMSPWWFFGFLIPGVNVLAQIVWSFRIVRAREKSAVVAVLLLIPVLNLLALAYLAFSHDRPILKSAPRVEIMTLETA